MDADRIIRLVRAARGLEAGGFYNAAKLLWAVIYSQEIVATNATGIPRGTELNQELGAILDEWRGNGVNPALIAALEKGREAVAAESTISLADSPDIYVSRTSGEIFLGEPPEFTAGGDHRLGLRKFLPVWYLEPLAEDEMLAALASAPDTIEDQLAGLSADQMEVSPAPGEWSIRQLLEHLLMAQQLLAARVEKLLIEENPQLGSLAVWSMEQEIRLPAEIMQHFRESRNATVKRLKTIDIADWQRSGWHDEWGRVTVRDQATYFARHEMSHLPQFRQIRDVLNI